VKIKNALINLFLGLLVFVPVTLILCLFYIQDAYTSAFCFSYLVAAYLLLSISVLAFLMNEASKKTKLNVFYSGFSPVILSLYLYMTIAAKFTSTQNHEPQLVIFKVLIAIGALYYLFLLLRSPLQWYFKVFVGCLLLFMPYLYFMGVLAICHSYI
jgi:hypothetical protein